ncbi:uncharacterized protein LOC125232831 isoform X3 [Leguminivora glycinivorella]|uniref:uncharacterized protein LOC125232831 isoform X3 n=1 Tax=Leguminivora glycinivorella TaxID=1035111 RepID=UPI00200DD597|nr:uncharacterized protein LOC125232831 isoform X3 [Leguminivora glycinivorella]
MDKVLCFILLLNAGLVYSQLLSTVNNVRLVNHMPYILEVMETTMKDVEAHGWCNLKIPNHEVEIDENIFDWTVKGRVAFKNGFVTSIQKVDLIQSTLQQVWRFDNSDNTTSVFVQATLRMVDVRLGYDVEVTLDDGRIHHFTGIFRHNIVQYPFAYDVTSAATGMAAWASDVFQPILLNVTTYKVKFPQICYNCNA